MTKTRKNVKLSTLKNAKHNPPNRTMASQIKDLVASMKQFGQMQPITISSANVIIEGHRRTAAAKALGWTEIEANVVKDCDADALYGSMNTTMKPLSGCDALYVWLKNPNAVTAKQAKKFSEMVSVIGRATVVEMSKKGFSLRLFQTAAYIARYCDQDDAETITKIVKYFIKFSVVGQVMKAISAGESSHKILEAIKKGKQVKLSLSVG